MKQKIEVEIKPAVNEQWPILRGASESFPDGWEYYVMRGSMHYLYKNEGGGYPDKVCGEIACQILDYKQRLFFKDFASAIAWLNNPQPVKAEPETIKVKDLKSGSFFQVGKDIFLHATCQHCPTLTNIGTTVVFDDNREVIPFYGQITINVGRDKE